MLIAQLLLSDMTIHCRIDEDIEAGNEHVERGHRALLNALTSASSNRALQMKLLAVLGAFAVFFMLFAL
jgi:hypothetical protein